MDPAKSAQIEQALRDDLDILTESGLDQNGKETQESTKRSRNIIVLSTNDETKRKRVSALASPRDKEFFHEVRERTKGSRLTMVQGFSRIRIREL